MIMILTDTLCILTILSIICESAILAFLFISMLDEK